MVKILWCYHSNETSSAVLSQGTIYLSMQFEHLSLWMKSYGVTIQMKPLQQYFHTILFIQYYVVSTDLSLWMKSYGVHHSNKTSSAVLSQDTIFFSMKFQHLSLWMKSYGAIIQMKPLQLYFHTILFIQYVVLTFESVDEILWCSPFK